MKRLSIILAVVFALVGHSFGQVKTTPALMNATSNSKANDKTPVIITMASQYDATEAARMTAFLGRKERAQFVMEDLQRFSYNSQYELLAFLEGAGEAVSDIQPFWIFNGISCQATPSVIAALAQRPDVACIDYDAAYTTAAVDQEPTELNRDTPWNLAKIHAEEVWNYNGSSGYTGQGIVVAIIDSGINYNHNELQTHMWTNSSGSHGHNYINNSENPIEGRTTGNGNGTAVAGIVAGTNTGVAPGAQLMALKVSNSTGGGINETRICNAIEYAVTNGADIIVITANEIGVGGRASYRDKMVNLLSAGIVAVTSAGDNGQNRAVPNSIAAPSNCPSPWHNPDELINGGRSANICVGAVNSGDYKAATSSIGPVTWAGIGSYNDYPYTAGSTTAVGHIRPDLVAPGVQVTTTSHLANDAMISVSSSIASAAHVAGVAALLLEANPELTPAQIDQILETSAVKCESLHTKNNYYGAGRVDALEAMNALKSTVNAPTNLTATVTGSTVSLSWTASSGASSYELFCDETSIATGITGTTYTHHPNVSGAHVYYVKAIQSNGKPSGKSNQVKITITPSGPVVSNLQATKSGEALNNVILTWEAPEANNVMSYCGDSPKLNAHPTTYWAQRFTPSQLLPYAGNSIDTLQLFVTASGNYNIALYKGNPNGPSEELYNQNHNISATANSWYSISLGNGVQIDHTQDLWIVCHSLTNISKPAAYCMVSNPTGFQSLYSSDGLTWSSMNTSFCWMIKAILTGDTYTYNVQRNGTTIASDVNGTTYTDNNVPGGSYDYTVTTNYNNHQSVSFPCDPCHVNIQTQFTVTFNAGSGTCTPTQMQQQATDAPITLPAATPTTACQQEGYTFAGWTETPIEGTSTAPDLYLANTEFTPDSDMTLYAVYVKSEGLTGWSLTRHIASGDLVCIVIPDLSAELDDYYDTIGLITSVGYVDAINGAHPFTVHNYQGQTYYFEDADGNYLYHEGSHYISFTNQLNGGCYWNVEFINGNAFLRNSFNSTNTQLMAIEYDDGSYFWGVDYSQPLDDECHHLQLYRYTEASNSYYAHNPNCGATVTLPNIQPLSDGAYFLDPVTVTITTATPGATIHYTLNGFDPDETSPVYSANNPIVLDEYTVVKAKAYKTGFTPSEIASQTYLFPTNYSNIMAFKNAANSNVVSRITSTMTVTQWYEKSLYVSDATGGLLIYDDYGLLTGTYNEGDIITNIQGRYAEVNQQVMMKAHHDITVDDHGDLVEPTILTVNDINTNYVTHDSKLVKVESVNFIRDIENGFDTISIDQNGTLLLTRNLFDGVTGSYDSITVYDVVGILGNQGGVKSLYPRTDDDIRNYFTITCNSAQHGTITAPASASHLSTVTLTITPENNYHVATLAYYTTNPSATTPIDLNTCSFVMPAANVTVIGSFEVNVTYTVSFEAGSGSCTTTSITETAWNQGVVLPVATPSSNCANEGYTFAGWATEEIEETLITPTLYAAGSTYHPQGNCTLWAVYTMARQGWEDVTSTDDLKDGYYVFASKSHNMWFYLPHQGAVSQNPIASTMTVSNGVPSATDTWKIEKINATEYSISEETNGTTYYLKAYQDAVQAIRITNVDPGHGWSFIDDNTKGLLATYSHPAAKGDRTQRFIDLNFDSFRWYFRGYTSVEGELHLFLSPSNLYATNPDCQMAVATPTFLNLPEDLIFSNNYMVTLSCATQGASIYYTTDGTEPTNASTLYTAPFAISDDCTVKAIAYVNGDYSLVATQAFTFATRYATIAEFKAAYSASSQETCVITGDIQFVYRGGNNIYVCDATAGLLVKDINNVITNTYSNGDVISGGLIGNYVKLAGQPMMYPAYNPAAGVAGTPVTPVVLTTVAGYDQYDAQLVTFTSTVFTEDYNFNNTNNGFHVDKGLTVANQFQNLTLEGQSGDRYDITGFAGKNNSTNMLYPRDDTDFDPYYAISYEDVQHGSISGNTYAKANDLVTLTSNPETGYVLEDWVVTDEYNNNVPVTDNSFTMPEADVTVSATFILADYEVNVVANPTNGGTVTGSSTYHYNDMVHVTATPSAGYEFYGWNIPTATPQWVYGVADTLFQVTGNMTIIAKFNPVTTAFQINLHADPAEGGTVSGAGQYFYGTQVTIVATPNEGYAFVNWTYGDAVVSTEPSYTFTATSNMTFYAHFEATAVSQTTAISSGWNWYSSYIAYDDNSLGTIEDSIAAHTGSALIKSQTQFVSLNNNAWNGGLNTLDNTQMYMIRSDNSLNLTLSGAAVDPTQTPITLSTGWTWISFLNSNSISLEQALAGLTPSNGDLIKSQNGFSSYNSATGWNGSMTTLEPGQGYLYLNQGTAANTLTYPVASRDDADNGTMETYWSVDVHRFATNMSMMLSLDANQFNRVEGRYEIGAFVGDDCRGAARLQQVGDQLVAFLTVSGEAGEEIHFELYDLNENKVYVPADERVSYRANDVYGTTVAPMLLHFGCTGVQDLEARLNLYPNPVKDQVRIEGAGIDEVKVYDMLGQLVLAKTYAGEDGVVLDLGTLSAGVYTVALRAEGNLVTRRLVKE